MFHLSKNFWNHISPIIADRTKFHRLTSLFWKIAKNTDSQSLESFDDEWDSFKNEISSAATEGKRCDDALDWLDDLRTKAPQFAYRYTWQHLTLLVNATVRSEAINSALKTRAVHANKKLWPLVEDMDDYNVNSRTGKAQDAVRLALRQHTTPGLPLWVDRLRAKVTPYAFELICAQYTLSVNYRATLMPDQDGVDVWHRKYRLVPFEPAAFEGTYVYDDMGNLQTSAPEDFGLCDSCAPDGRIVSIVECSCQFGISSGLDTCRHRMNRVGALMDEISDEDLGNITAVNIANKWLVLSPEEESAATRRLRLKPNPKSFNLPAVVPATTETNNDRYLLMMAEFRVLAERCKESATQTHDVLQAIQTMNNSYLSGIVNPAALHGAGGNEEDEELSPPGHDNDGGFSADWKHLLKLFGDRFQDIDSDVDEEYLKFPDVFFFGETIAYKWKGAGKGGWYLGELTHIPDSGRTLTAPFGDAKPVNFSVYFPADGNTAECALYEENYAYDIKTRNAPQHFWVLLGKKTLGEDLVATARNQGLRAPRFQASSTKGRKSNRRLRPAHGPTSSTSHRNRGKA